MGSNAIDIRVLLSYGTMGIGDDNGGIFCLADYSNGSSAYTIATK